MAPNSAAAGEEVHFNNIFYLYTFYKFLIIINQGDNVEAFDQYDDPDFHRCSDAQPFRGLCASLKNSYGGRGNYVYYTTTTTTTTTTWFLSCFSVNLISYY